MPRHLLLLLALSPFLSFSSASAREPTAEQLAFFEKKIRPVLASKCYSCHSSETKKPKGGLLLDSREGLRAGGDSGQAFVAGEPAKSMLIQALHHQDKTLRMPPKEKLSDEIIADFEHWVRIGAPDPRSGGTIEMSCARFWRSQRVITSVTVG